MHDILGRITWALALPICLALSLIPERAIAQSPPTSYVYGCEARPSTGPHRLPLFSVETSKYEPGKKLTEAVSYSLKRATGISTSYGYSYYITCEPLLDDNARAAWLNTFESLPIIDFVPEFASRLSEEPLSSRKQIKTVSFRQPKYSLGQKGYTNVTFNLEYQFITCQGELHLAYSVVEDSVRAEEPTYALEGRLYNVGPPAPTITSVPLKGSVHHFYRLIGEFADDHAAKALGFGCFSGQSKKIATIKEIQGLFGDKVGSDAKLKDWIDELKINVETPTILTSTYAEGEITNGKSKVADRYDRPANTNSDLDAAAADRASRKAAEEAEFQAKQKVYEEGMAAHKAAIEKYEKALADAKAQQVAGVAKAEAAKLEFARKQAEYEAEAARARKAQEEYESKYVAPR